MRRVAAVVGAVAFVVATTAVFAQKPNFAGKWTVDTEKTTAANPAPAGGAAGGGGGRGGAGGGAGRGGGATTFELKMDGNKLSRISEGQNGPMTQDFVVDGAKHDGTQQGSTYVAKWDGNTIVIESTRDMQGTAFTTTQIYSMEGENLVITSKQPGRNGGEAPPPRKTFYKKA